MVIRVYVYPFAVKMVFKDVNRLRSVLSVSVSYAGTVSDCVNVKI